MIPIDQTKLSAQDGSVRGNCLRACLASILEIDIDSIPFFEDMDREWHTPFFDFLDDNNLEFEGTGYFGVGRPDKMKEFMEYEGIDGYVIVGGKSPRTWVKGGHAVVYKDGKLIHDPHPSRDGILEMEDYFMIKKKIR